MRQGRSAPAAGTLARRLVCVVILVAGGWPAAAVAGETLMQVKSRGALRCGVSEGIAGFSVKDGAGQWSGLDVDFCRAVAAATLGGGDKVAFVPLVASARFPTLTSGAIDLLVRNTTWTLGREAGLRIHFAGTLYYDEQRFLVPAGGVKSAAKLERATVCVEKDTAHERHLAEYSRAQGLNITPLVVDSSEAGAAALFAGRCGAYTADAARLAAALLMAPRGRAFVILPEALSKEPLGPVVRYGDDEWLTLVQWVLFALITAEETGLTQARAYTLGSRPAETAARRALGGDAESGKALGLEADWPLRVVQSVGNYGEMFDRNLGPGSSLKLARGLNRLWSDGGLMYAPPMR